MDHEYAKKEDPTDVDRRQQCLDELYQALKIDPTNVKALYR